MEHLSFLTGEIDKAVDIHARVRKVAGLYLLCEKAEPVRGVGMAVGDGGVVGFNYERKLRELVAQAVGAGGGGGAEFGVSDAGGLELIHGGQQHGLQLRTALRRGIHTQARTEVPQREGHAQQPAALVEPGSSRPTAARGHLPREAGEAEHLGIQREPVPAAPAELAFGLMAVLLRDYEHNPALPVFHAALYFIYDGSGLAGTRTACNESEHSPVSLPYSVNGFCNGYNTSEDIPL